jgi:hypothetical protein
MSEPRRSSRANKGRNQRLEAEKEEAELLYRQQLKEESDRAQYTIKPESVLCTVCATTDDNYDAEKDTRDMIQCDSCLSWQHNECILANPESVPEVYYCNICDPSNSHYKTLKYELDPTPYISTRPRVKKTSQNKNKSAKKEGKEDSYSDEDGEFQDDGKNDNDEDQFSDNGPQEEGDDDEDFDEGGSSSKKRESPEVKKRSRSRSSVSNSSSTPKLEKKPKVNPGASHDDIEQKARDAVTRRFDGMFKNLLQGQKVPEEVDTVDLPGKWAKKLEAELFDCYHDRETGKLGKDYKEVSTRVFVNVKDLKNIKLRMSIINKSISFYKLVRMPVNELLNPDLRKEKEEAIKESTSLATLEQGKVSNIRRTHKGDIVLEKDENSSTQQFDFNVGVTIDNDEKRFSKSENTVNSSSHRNIDNDIDFNDEDNAETSFENNDKADPGHTIDDDKEDEDLAAILADEKKPEEESKQDSYDPTEGINDSATPIWEGQTIFTGFTNFESTITKFGTTLADSEFSLALPHLLDPNLPLMIEGRLDAGKADKYIDKVAGSRKLILLELHGHDNEKNFNKLFDYFHSKAKFGVIPNKSTFVKDVYLFPIYEKIPHFIKRFHHLEKFESGLKRLFLVFIIKQEFLQEIKKLEHHDNDSYDPSNVASVFTDQALSSDLPNSFAPGFEFLSKLNPNELRLVNSIFEKHQETRTDPSLLIQFLQNALSNNQQF